MLEERFPARTRRAFAAGWLGVTGLQHKALNTGSPKPLNQYTQGLGFRV